MLQKRRASIVGACRVYPGNVLPNKTRIWLRVVECTSLRDLGTSVRSESRRGRQLYEHRANRAPKSLCSTAPDDHRTYFENIQYALKRILGGAWRTDSENGRPCSMRIRSFADHFRSVTRRGLPKSSLRSASHFLQLTAYFARWANTPPSLIMKQASYRAKSHASRTHVVPVKIRVNAIASQVSK